MSSKKLLEEIQQKALKMLREKLPTDLDYHNYEHTLDVLRAAERIAADENTSSEDMEILKTAAVLHDSGYINTRHEHEEESCRIAEKLLSSHGIEQDWIDKVCEIIRATKVPHDPKNKLSQIMCDADLDYLGREDFFPISNTVFKEFKKHGIVKDEAEWNKLQIRFFESHKYFTATSVRLRKQKKMEHLEMLKNLVAQAGGGSY